MQASPLVTFDPPLTPGPASDSSVPSTMVLDNVTSIAAATGPLYVISVWGEGCSGKSSFLNALLCFLSEGGFLASATAVAAKPFTACAGHTAVTNGIDFIVFPRASGGSFVLLDTEGVGNGEGPAMKAILTLAFSSGGTHVCLNATHIDDACIASAGRVGVAGIGGASVLFGGSAHAAKISSPRAFVRPSMSFSICPVVPAQLAKRHTCGVALRMMTAIRGTTSAVQ